jgi:hypothetical protein
MRRRYLIVPDRKHHGGKLVVEEVRQVLTFGRSMARNLLGLVSKENMLEESVSIKEDKLQRVIRRVCLA